MSGLFRKQIAPSNKPLFRKTINIAPPLFKKGSSDLNLHDVLKNSYANSSQQASFGADKGYVYDKDLSNHNQQVYYHPQDKKLVVSVAGTHNASDILTDARMMAGGLKNTDRYKQAQATLQNAKAKYGVDSATIAGHSLGGVIGSYIGGSNDKVYTLDKAQTIGNRNSKNEKAYRSAGDVVSLLGANKIKTIGSGSVLTGGIAGALSSHNVSNIQNAGIII
jgi:hypothetical protein